MRQHRGAHDARLLLPGLLLAPRRLYVASHMCLPTTALNRLLAQRPSAPPSFLSHSAQVVGLFMAVGFWALCYSVQPGKTVARPLVRALPSSQRATAAYDRAMASAMAQVRRMSWLRAVSAVSRSGCGWDVLRMGGLPKH